MFSPQLVEHIASDNEEEDLVVDHVELHQVLFAPLDLSMFHNFALHRRFISSMLALELAKFSSTDPKRSQPSDLSRAKIFSNLKEFS